MAFIRWTFAFDDRSIGRLVRFGTQCSQGARQRPPAPLAGQRIIGLSTTLYIVSAIGVTDQMLVCNLQPEPMGEYGLNVHAAGINHICQFQAVDVSERELPFDPWRQNCSLSPN